MPQTPNQVIVNTTQDPGLNYMTQRDKTAILANNNKLTTTTDKAIITNTIQNVTQIITNTIIEAAPGGVNNDIQVNEGNAFTGFDTLTYDPVTDTFTTINVNADNIVTGNIVINGISNLGAVGNITITGGNNKQVLTTDGLGNVTWANALPTLLNNSGKFLTNDGNSNVTWAQVSYASLSNLPNFANIATTGSYTDLTNIPNNIAKYVNVPTSSAGQPGDAPGMWAQDTAYFYYCNRAHTGDRAAIWRRIAADANNIW